LLPPTTHRSTDSVRPPRAPPAAWSPSPAAFYPDRCSQSSANEVPDPSARGQGTTSGEPARGCHNIIGPVEVRLLERTSQHSRRSTISEPGQSTVLAG